MTKKSDKQSAIQEKRNYLKGLSKPIQMLVKEGAMPNVNHGLKQIYSQEGHDDLKTIWEWNDEGKRVKKGEKALLLWGSPRKAKVKITNEGNPAIDDEMQFYPICYVFSAKQVQEAEKGGKQ